MPARGRSVQPAPPLALWLVVSLACVACGAEPEAPATPLDLTGSWRVRGMTTEVEAGVSRDIAGMLILVQDGEAYTASFHLTTLYPTPEGPMPAEVVGTGEGRLENGDLVGTSRTQLIMAMVPGEAGQFPLAPRRYGPRLLSHTTGSIQPDGSLVFETANASVGGDAYPATRTKIHGVRVEARPKPGAPPPS